MFIISTFIISKQEETPLLSEIVQKITMETKMILLEKNLKQHINLNGSITIWDTEEIPDENILNQYLHTLPEYSSVLACKPLGYGYTTEQANKLFLENATYPDCLQETPECIAIDEGFLVGNTCSNWNISYALGTTPSEERFGRLSLDLEWEEMASDVPIGETEFAFLKYPEGRQATSFINFNQEAAGRADKITKEWIKNLNIKITPRPLTVFLLMFDSLSRQHMYRSFNETIDFLNKTISTGKYTKEFAMYDFIINHSHAENTIPNMIPYLFGYANKYHKLRIKNFNFNDESHAEKFIEIQEDSLWKHYEKMGFVTMFGFDIIWDFLVPAVGREIKADHVFTNFWKLSRRVFGTDNYINEHKCFGSHNSHWYMLNYVKEFIKAYEGHNRFGYAHITTAHEKSGTIIKTVDPDLLNMLKELLEYFNNHKEEDFVFIIAGDHGKHVSESDIVKEGWLENMLPAQIVIANQDLMKRLKAHSIFHDNSQRLVSRADWHITLKHLSITPYGNLIQDSALYNHWKKITETEFAVSLLLESTNPARTCSDLDIEKYFCVCLPYDEINDEDMKNDPEINALTQLAIDYINSKTDHELCTEIETVTLKYAAIRNIAVNYQVYRLRFTLTYRENIEFEVFGSIFSKSREEMYMEEDILEMPVVNLANNLRGNDMKIQLLKLIRIDEFAGYMEEYTIVAKQKPSFCIPKELTAIMSSNDINNKEKKVFEELIQALTIRLADINTTCYDACFAYDEVCQHWALEFISNQAILEQEWRQTLSYNIEGIYADTIVKNSNSLKADYFGYANDTIFYPSKSIGCFDKINETQLICPCK